MPKNIPRTDETQTDRIYGSGDRSVIQNAAGDRKGRPGDPLVANPSYRADNDNESTDKYYKSPVAPGAVSAAEVPETRSMLHPESTAPLTLSNEAELGGVVDLALDRARAGQKKVIVQATDADLARRLNAHLDMALARVTIDDAQRRAIQVGRPVNLLDAAVASPGAVGLTEEEVEKMLPDKTPTTEAASVEGLALGVDPGAFVRGEIPEDSLDENLPAPVIRGDVPAPAEGGLTATVSKPPLSLRKQIIADIVDEADQQAIASMNATLAGANEEDDTDDDDDEFPASIGTKSGSVGETGEEGPVGDDSYYEEDTDDEEESLDENPE